MKPKVFSRGVLSNGNIFFFPYLDDRTSFIGREIFLSRMAYTFLFAHSLLHVVNVIREREVKITREFLGELVAHGRSIFTAAHRVALR